MALTDLQKRFVAVYTDDMTSDDVIAALGLHPRAGKAQVSKMLKDPDVQTAMAARAITKAPPVAEAQAAAIPPRPPNSKLEGDKSPAVMEWYRVYCPSAYAQKYGRKS